MKNLSQYSTIPTSKTISECFTIDKNLVAAHSEG